MELLSPAGNYESFIGAINAGADAIYLAGSSYGARAYADNFSDEEIIRAIDYAHLLGKKVYLTVNTLIKDKEVREAIDFLRPFYLAGLDGVIIQDIGLICAFKEIYPKLELHASTQCFITGTNSAKYFKDLGCSRVVLARELGFNEISDIKKETGLEIETFIHGSMCYSYSGDCLFSSCLGQRSGNRGRCAGPCRLSYDVHDTHNKANVHSGYYLSMKDQCTLALIPKLVDAGIDSLKIEGRMKKPEYSAFVTSIYRKYIDLYLKAPSEFRISNSDLDKLKSIYLRSQIQEGYYERIKGKEMISIDSPSYNGSDDSLMESIREHYLNSIKKLPVSMYFYIAKDNNILLTINCGEKYITVEGTNASEAIKSALTDDSITKNLSKLGDTFFCPESITIDNDNDSFVPVSAINDIRRRGIEALTEELLKDFRRSEDDISEPYKATESFSKQIQKKNIVSIMTEEQFNAVMDYKDDFSLCLSSDLIDEVDLSSIDKNELIIELPHVLRKRNESKVLEIVNRFPNSLFVCHNLEELFLLKSMNMSGRIIAGPEVYNWNRFSTQKIDDDCILNIMPYELNSHEMDDVLNLKSVIMAYGRVPLMISENCVQRTSFTCKGDGVCEFTYISDRKKVDLPVYLSCKYCYNIIYNAIRTSLHEFIVSKKLSFSNYLINFTNESYEETQKVLDFYTDILSGKEAVEPFKDFTKSYYNKGVE